MKNIKMIIILLIFTLNKIYSDSLFDDLFDEIEAENIGQMEGGGIRTDPLQISGEHEFIFSLPYNDIERFKTPEFNNTFTIEYNTEKVRIVSIWEFNIPENRIIPDENYIKLNLKNTTVQGGYSLFSWGHGDEQNPTDRLNSKDYSNPLDIKKIPAMSVSVEQYLGDLSLQVVYIPVKSASIFSLDMEDKIFESLIASDNISIEDINTIEKFIIGGRINYYGIVDLSLSYIYNYDDNYVPTVDVNPAYNPMNPASETPLTGLELKNQRAHMIGLSGKTILGPLGIWLEGNYSRLETSEDYLEWTAGLDFSFGRENQGYLNIQTVGKWTPDYIKAPGMSDMSDYSNISDFYVAMLTGTLQNIESELLLGFVTKISYKLLDEELEPELISMYLTSLEDPGVFIIKPSISYKPIDSLSFKLGINIVSSPGDHGGPSKQYNEIHKDDNIFLSTKYSW